MSKSDSLPIVSYAAMAKDKIIGIATGVRSATEFYLSLFIVHPKYQNGIAAKQILDRVRESNQKVTLIATQFGGKTNKTVDQLDNRQRALVSYYKKFGFKVQSSETSDGVLMVWEREKPNN